MNGVALTPATLSPPASASVASVRVPMTESAEALHAGADSTFGTAA
jgi:hypothetical protein